MVELEGHPDMVGTPGGSEEIMNCLQTDMCLHFPINCVVESVIPNVLVALNV